jgi:hypothetical protein
MKTAALLTAFERSSPSEEMAHRAFSAFCVVEQHGWEIARQLFNKRGWYKYLAIMRRVGIEVPAGAGGRDFADGPGARWIDINSSDSPGEWLYKLVGQRFELIRKLDEFYNIGDTGNVAQVSYHHGRFYIGVDFNGVPGGFEELPVGQFLASSRPLAKIATETPEPACVS